MSITEFYNFLIHSPSLSHFVWNIEPSTCLDFLSSFCSIFSPEIFPSFFSSTRNMYRPSNSPTFEPEVSVESMIKIKELWKRQQKGQLNIFIKNILWRLSDIYANFERLKNLTDLINRGGFQHILVIDYFPTFFTQSSMGIENFRYIKENRLDHELNLMIS